MYTNHRCMVEVLMSNCGFPACQMTLCIRALGLARIAPTTGLH